MTPDQFRAALERLGETQVGLARRLGIADRTVRRWATGDEEIPRSVVMLLAVMRRYGLGFDQVETLAGRR